MKLKYINIYLNRKFRILGICVATHPLYFVIIPIFLSAILSTGFQKWYENNNFKYLFAPDNTRYIKEEAAIEKLFPMDLNVNANIERMSREPCIAIVLITVKDGGSVLRPNIFQEILSLDKIIQNITVKESNMKYRDLCSKNNGKCLNNTVLSLGDRIDKMKEGNYSIKYPLSIEGRYNYHLNSFFLGGIETDDNDNIKTAKAMNLYYYLNDQTISIKSYVKQWQRLFLKTVSSVTFQHLNVDRYVAIEHELEVKQIIYRVFPRMPLAIILIIVFSMITCIYKNWIESKPWTGVIALISGGLSLVSAFGTIMYFNIPFVSPASSIFLLILGIGMDDAFVLLSAWKNTDPNATVSNRLGEAYFESSISITITSITNFVAFSAGIFAPYKIMRYFCSYATSAVFFCYIYQLTFVGACMAICGYAEKQNRHSFLFFKMEKSQEKMSMFDKIFFNYDASKSEINRSENSTIWEKLGKILSLWPTKVIIMLILNFHIAVGIYGITQIDTTAKYTDPTISDSYLNRYLQKDIKYFSKYKFRFQIVINETVNYADTEIQRKVEKVFSDLKASNLIEDSLTESWLRSFLKFVSDERMSSIVNEFNMSNSEDFIKVLNGLFLHHPSAKRFRNDIAFNSDYTAIIGSRFLCQTLHLKDENVSIHIFQKIRTITDKVSFVTFPYFPSIFWLDSAASYIKVTIQMLCSISATLIIICIIFMPDIIVIFSITFSVICTEICALGYMALWNVRLAPVSIMILVLCAGFSVDYAAHLSHVYSKKLKENPNECLRNSINCIGLAIFQGSATTIISIIPLSIPLAYTLVISFKIIFLVILFSVMNALIFLPVLLSILHVLKEKIFRNSVKISENTNKKKNVFENRNFDFNTSEI